MSVVVGCQPPMWEPELSSLSKLQESAAAVGIWGVIQRMGTDSPFQRSWVNKEITSSTNVVAQWVKPQPTMQAAHLGSLPVHVPATSVLVQLPANVPGK